MYRYSNLRTLHLEMTQRCNARCPQCSRFTKDGRVKPSLPLAELTLEDIRSILPPELVTQLTLIYLSGNYGDPAMAADTLSVLEYLRRTNPRIRLNVHTNGSLRDVSWWKSLAGIVDKCIFGIDGLEDTHSLYRVGTHWGRIIENARVFIAAGGNAHWQFLVFKHNEHHVEEARRLSVEMGFRGFFVKSTSRQFENGKKLEPPSQAELRNKQVMKLEAAAHSPEAHRQYLAETEIRCKATVDSSFYLSAEGYVLPCCWTASLYPERTGPEDSEVGRLVSRLPGGFSAISAKLRPVAEIIEGDFFQKLIPELWQSRPDRLKVCAKNCGGFDIQSGQYVAGPNG